MKKSFEKTNTDQMMLRLFVKDARRLAGIGGQYLVLQSASHPGYIDKFSYVLAGSDRQILRNVLAGRRQEFGQVQQYFGDLVLPVSYRIALLPARGPMGRLWTVCGRQQKIRERIDLFSTEAVSLMQIPGYEQLRKELGRLIRKTESWSRQERYLDIIGPENVVITTDSGEPHIRIIDTEPYAPEYMDDINPILGISYRTVFFERLDILKALYSGNAPALHQNALSPVSSIDEPAIAVLV